MPCSRFRSAAGFELAVWLFVAFLGSAGCGSSSPPENGNSKKVSPAQETQQKNLQKLPIVDRSAAERQRDCPVSGKPLGSMGKPLKVVVKNQTVWICCESCKESLLETPDKYLKRLKKSP